MRLLRYVPAFVIFATQLIAQPTGNVMGRVCQIRFNGISGTALVVDYEDRQYVVTADHMVANAGETARGILWYRRFSLAWF